MVIAFDSWNLESRFQHSGIGLYSRRLLKYFREFASLHEDLVIRPFIKPGNSNGMAKLQVGPGFEPTPSGLLRLGRVWRCGGVTAAAVKHDADVVFCPYGQIVPLGVVPVVTTIHDTTPITSPSHSAYMNRLIRAFYWLSANFSHKVLADSECSKKDLVRIYGLPPGKVRVIYLGYDRDTFDGGPADPAAQKALLTRHGIRTPYILHHGTIQPRKNLERLIQAYRLLLERRRDLDLQLVLAGPLGWQYEAIVRTVEGHGFSGDVVLTGALSDEELALVVKGATASVIPSLYEGFCLPMVESMACGVPTITANASCLPEVSGNVLRYFDPYSVDEMAQVIEEVVKDTELRRSLINGGLRRAKEFSWERCAKETLEELMNPHARA